MREKQIERKLVGGGKIRRRHLPEACIAPAWTGCLTAWCFLEGCRIGFVEVKAPGKEPRPLQTNRHRMLRSLGFPVFVLDDPGQIPGILQEVAAWRR